MPLLYHKTVYHVLALPVYYVTTLYTSVVRNNRGRFYGAGRRGRRPLHTRYYIFSFIGKGFSLILFVGGDVLDAPLTLFLRFRHGGRPMVAPT